MTFINYFSLEHLLNLTLFGVHFDKLNPNQYALLSKMKKLETTKKIIESKILNLLGIQIFRYTLAKIIYKFVNTYHKNSLKEYETKGYYFQENFLSQEEFLKIRN